ncbi:MAG: hypothetical protein IIC01_12680 [Planctomycetes bacterium]|nr:hypothetical protein [Planctomycetota bacterium]
MKQRKIQKNALVNHELCDLTRSVELRGVTYSKIVGAALLCYLKGADEHVQARWMHAIVLLDGGCALDEAVNQTQQDG